MRKIARFLIVGFVFSLSFFNNAFAQNTQTQKPPKKFFTFYMDWEHTAPLHFQEYPLEQFAGVDLGVVYEPRPERYRTPDESITVSNIGFSKSTQGFGAMIYPFGTRKYATLAIKIGHKELPDFHFDMKKNNRTERYQFINGRALDLGVGIMISDLRPGWKLGSSSYLLVGKGWITEDRGKGDRYFIEAGGGVNVGIVGIGIYFGITQNRLSVPQDHMFYTVPMGLRTSVTF